MAAGESGWPQFEKAAESILGVKMWVSDHVQRTVGTLGNAGRLLFTEHHMAHAASAFYPSPYASAAILTLDGVGEWATTTLGRGAGSEIELLKQLITAFAGIALQRIYKYFCGLKVNSGEYKLMGLAPYGRPRYADRIQRELD